MEKIKVDSTIPEEVVTAECEPIVEAPAKAVGVWGESAEAKTCSLCGYELHGWAMRQSFKYCPNCGAEMRCR